MSPRPSQQAIGSRAPPAAHLGGRRASAGERLRGGPTSARRQRAVACRCGRSERRGDRSAPTPNQTSAARPLPPAVACRPSGQPIAACMHCNALRSRQPTVPSHAGRSVQRGRPALPPCRRCGGPAAAGSPRAGAAGMEPPDGGVPGRGRPAGQGVRSGVHAGLHVWRPLQLPLDGGATMVACHGPRRAGSHPTLPPPPLPPPAGRRQRCRARRPHRAV